MIIIIDPRFVNYSELATVKVCGRTDAYILYLWGERGVARGGRSDGDENGNVIRRKFPARKSSRGRTRVPLYMDRNIRLLSRAIPVCVRVLYSRCSKRIP